jgi:isoleucyl-tRNA synthetase
MRKDSGFNVTDHIMVSVTNNDNIISYVKANEDKIGKVVLCETFTYSENAKHNKEWDINGEKVTLGVEVV